MGKSKKSKKLLKDGCLTSNILTEEVKVTDSTITWYVKNYSTLHQNICYFTIFKEHNNIWKLGVRRRKPFNISVLLQSDNFVSDIIIFIRGSNGNIMDRFTVSEDNAYCATFDEQKILAPFGNLIDDILTVQFLYNTRPHEKIINLTPGLKQCGELKTSDEDILFNDLRDLYLSAKFYDFILNAAGNVKFKVHKLILFRHSKYLARKVREDREWTGDYFDVGANPDALHKVLLYLYSGELTNLDFESIRDVYFIASSLEISSLQDICVHFFRSTFSVDNVYDLLVSALVHDNIDFQREIILFLNKQPEAVRRKRAWAEVIREVIKYVPEDMRELSES